MLIPEKRPDYGIILNKKIDLWKNRLKRNGEEKGLRKCIKSHEARWYESVSWLFECFQPII
jgi:hypothetical protein